MENWIGLTVAEVMRQCGANYQDLELVDDPPGKLRAVSLTCPGKGKREKVTLEFAWQPELFSRERTWDRATVESQKVTEVHRETKDLR